MHKFFSSIFLLFLSPVGLVILAALDSSMAFFLPTAVEAAEVILIARNRELVWLFPILATVGSVAGALVTFLIGARIGEEGLDRWLSKGKLQTFQEKIKNKGALPLGSVGLMPPPFPLSVFILVCGALGVKKPHFLIGFGVARLVRFSIIAVFGFLYGGWILRVMESHTFQIFVAAFATIVIVGTAVSIYRISQKAKGPR
jgi:membrane protein YqaA with SNARE-associated domain